MPQGNQRQYVKYTFYKLDPQWRRLSSEEKRQGKEEFLSIIDEFSDRMFIKSYSLVGIRGDSDFLLWKISQRLEDFLQLTNRLLSTGLGHYLNIPYSYLAMTKESMYLEKHRHSGQEGTRLAIKPTDAKYLFIYPFLKTREWYHLPKDTRQGMMDVHIQVGHKYPSVKLNTTYSFGLDDQEFVLAFETDNPSDFLDLVMELRETDSSLYTLRDTPIFTCIAMNIKETLESLGD